MRTAPLLLLLPANLLGACRTSEPVPPAPAPAPEAAPALPAQKSGARPPAPEAGALGIGDPYYPALGNGGYDVEHYDLALEIDMASGIVAATAALRARALVDLLSFSLDLYGLDVESVSVNGVEADYEHEDAELVITPAEPIASRAVFETVVVYGGVPDVRPDPPSPSCPAWAGCARTRGSTWSRSAPGPPPGSPATTTRATRPPTRSASPCPSPTWRRPTASWWRRSTTARRAPSSGAPATRWRATSRP
jgi:hypothetical protein